jgi:hypothetical protein
LDGFTGPGTGAASRLVLWNPNRPGGEVTLDHSSRLSLRAENADL